MSVVLLAVLGLVSVAPLARPGVLATQAGVLPLLRLLGAALPAGALSSGDPGWLYVLARQLAMAGGLTLHDALKFLTALAILGGGFGAYALATQAWGRSVGLLAGAFFFFLPVQIGLRFVQGVPGTPWFWALVLWAAWGVAQPERIGRLVIGSVLALVSVAGWPAATVLALPPLVLVAGGGWWRGRRRGLLAAGWIAAMLLVAVFRRSMAGPGTVLAPYQLFSAAWPESTAGEWVRGGSYSLGLLPILGTAFVVASASRLSLLSSSHVSILRSIGLAPTIAALLAVITLMPSAAPVVAALGGTYTIVGLAGLLLALTAARFPQCMPRPDRDTAIPWLAILVGIIALRGYPLLQPPTLPADVVPARPPRATFVEPQTGPAFMLLDVRAEPASSSKSITVVTRWQVLKQVQRNYTVFVHLAAADGRTVVQGDRLLLTDDERPSSRWGVGEIVTQTYTLEPSDGTTAGPYTVRLGLYLVDTLERLPRLEGGTAVEFGL